MIFQSVKVLRFGSLRFVLVVLLTKALTLCKCIQACERGRFGTHCELYCHCLANTCDKDGNCDECAHGFIGQKCQYVNDALFNAFPKTQYTDGQEKTCSSDTQETVYETEFGVEIFLTWFRFIVKNNANILNFTTKWNGNMTCGVNRNFIVDDRTLDGACDVPIWVHSVRIEGSVVGSLCEFQVSGGIYLSESGTISQTSNACNICGSDKAVDGDTSIDRPTHRCAVTKEETNQPSWFLKFFQPHIVHSVVIYGNESTSDLHKGMVVKTITSTGIQIILEKTLCVFFCDILREVRFQINPKWHHTPVVQLSVTQGSNNRGSKKQLIVCEIHAFGDIPCPKNTYGLFCTKCNCSDTEACNPYTGGCGVACPVGFYGVNCTFMCNAKCLDDVCTFDNGTCLRCNPGYKGETCTDECKNQTYGPDCMANCSQFCIGKCDHVTGDCSLCGKNRLAPRCIVCPAGFYGTNCSYACPVTCDKVCEVNSGECFNCIGNFTGMFCEDCADGYHGEQCEMDCSKFCLTKECDRLSGDCMECKGKRVGANCEDCEGDVYGLQCNHECSRFCFNHTCNAVTGKCDACNKGYQGEYCNRGPEKPAVYLAALSIFPIAFLIFFLVPDCRETSDDEED